MAPASSFVRDVMARFGDFVGPGIQWQRALWDVGVSAALREVREASEGVKNGAISTKSLKRHADSVVRHLSDDPGGGDPEQRRRIKALLAQDLTAGGVNFHELALWMDDVERHFLSRWETAAGQEHKPGRERTARALASEMLRFDFSPEHLRSWMRNLERTHDAVDAGQLFAEAQDLVDQGPSEFEVMLLFEQPPSQRLTRPEQWREARHVSAWLGENGFARPRQHGGLLLKIDARDPVTAGNLAFDASDRLAARSAVGTRENLAFHEHVFVRGQRAPMKAKRFRRAEVRALEREDTLLAIGADDHLDQGLELLSHLNTAPAPVAAAAGWSAVESLLSGPGDDDKVVTADRLANLVACSWPRAELTTVAWARVYQCEGSPDSLATELAAYSTNRERADRILKALTDEEDLQLVRPAEQLALRRMEKVFRSPRSELMAVRDRAGDALRRLYRQRNLVVHGGQTPGFGLASALRTAAPLVGAGLDRVTHAALVTGAAPLEIAARAQMEIERADTTTAPPLTGLLE